MPKLTETCERKSPVTKSGTEKRWDSEVKELALGDRLLHVMDENIDLALRIVTLPDCNNVAVKVGTICRVVCASPGYLKRSGRPQRPVDLADHDVVTFSVLALSEAWGFGTGAAARRANSWARLTFNTAEAAIDAAIAGVGLTRVLSCQIKDNIRAGLLVTVLGDHATGPVAVSLFIPARGCCR